MKNCVILILSFSMMLACAEQKSERTHDSTSEDRATGDATAIDLAEKVLQASGGLENWNNTRYLQWNFFGSRKWWWDKWTGEVRVESQRSDLRLAMNINSGEGKVFVHGSVQTHIDSLSKYLTAGKSMWINDSYWLVLPFKLLDPGVHLQYLGTRHTLDSLDAEVVQLTFEKVGDTPENKYDIYIDPQRHHVVQWDYYPNSADTAPRFQRPWTNYRRFGNIMLSDGRGTRGLSEVDVLEELPQEMFTQLEKPARMLLN